MRSAYRPGIGHRDAKTGEMPRLRVASAACRATAIPAISASRTSIERPACCFRAATRAPARRSARTTGCAPRSPPPTCGERVLEPSTSGLLSEHLQAGIHLGDRREPDGLARLAIEPSDHDRVGVRPHQRRNDMVSRMIIPRTSPAVRHSQATKADRPRARRRRSAPADSSLAASGKSVGAPLQTGLHVILQIADHEAEPSPPFDIAISDKITRSSKLSHARHFEHRHRQALKEAARTVPQAVPAGRETNSCAPARARPGHTACVSPGIGKALTDAIEDQEGDRVDLRLPISTVDAASPPHGRGLAGAGGLRMQRGKVERRRRPEGGLTATGDHVAVVGSGLNRS